MSKVDFTAAKLKLLAVIEEVAFKADAILLDACCMALANLENTQNGSKIINGSKKASCVS